MQTTTFGAAPINPIRPPVTVTVRAGGGYIQNVPFNVPGYGESQGGVAMLGGSGVHMLGEDTTLPPPSSTAMTTGTKVAIAAGIGVVVAAGIGGILYARRHHAHAGFGRPRHANRRRRA